MISFTVNGQDHRFEGDGDTPLLWVIRDSVGLTGTKFGCGAALCGACTVHVDGQPTRACVTPIESIEGQTVTTIEGVAGPVATAVQKAWNDLEVVQCGYCQSGQIMSAIALLSETPKPNDEDINAGMSGNICRCATYVRIRAAIHRASETLEG